MTRAYRPAGTYVYEVCFRYEDLTPSGCRPFQSVHRWNSLKLKALAVLCWIQETPTAGSWLILPPRRIGENQPLVAPS